MTAQQAKEQGYTHHAKLYGVSGFVHLEDDDEEGGFQFAATNWFGDKLVDIFVWIEVHFLINERGFPILMGEEL